MAKKFKNYEAHEPVHHKTSIGRKPSKEEQSQETKKNEKSKTVEKKQTSKEKAAKKV